MRSKGELEPITFWIIGRVSGSEAREEGEDNRVEGSSIRSETGPSSHQMSSCQTLLESVLDPNSPR